jgi:hypothetical protein
VRVDSKQLPPEKSWAGQTPTTTAMTPELVSSNFETLGELAYSELLSTVEECMEAAAPTPFVKEDIGWNPEKFQSPHK